MGWKNLYFKSGCDIFHKPFYTLWTKPQSTQVCHSTVMILSGRGSCDDTEMPSFLFCPYSVKMLLELKMYWIFLLNFVDN